MDVEHTHSVSQARLSCPLCNQAVLPALSLQTHTYTYTHSLCVWFGFVEAALLPAVGTCVVLAFGAMPGRCCFLRVTHTHIHKLDTPWDTFLGHAYKFCCVVGSSVLEPGCLALYSSYKRVKGRRCAIRVHAMTRTQRVAIGQFIGTHARHVLEQN